MYFLQIFHKNSRKLFYGYISIKVFNELLLVFEIDESYWVLISSFLYPFLICSNCCQVNLFEIFLHCMFSCTIATPPVSGLRFKTGNSRAFEFSIPDPFPSVNTALVSGNTLIWPHLIGNTKIFKNYITISHIASTLEA